VCLVVAGETVQFGQPGVRLVARAGFAGDVPVPEPAGTADRFTRTAQRGAPAGRSVDLGVRDGVADVLHEHERTGRVVERPPRKVRVREVVDRVCPAAGQRLEVVEASGMHGGGVVGAADPEALLADRFDGPAGGVFGGRVVRGGGGDGDVEEQPRGRPVDSPVRRVALTGAPLLPVDHLEALTAQSGAFARYVRNSDDLRKT